MPADRLDGRGSGPWSDFRHLVFLGSMPTWAYSPCRSSVATEIPVGSSASNGRSYRPALERSDVRAESIAGSARNPRLGFWTSAGSDWYQANASAWRSLYSRPRLQAHPRAVTSWRQRLHLDPASYSSQRRSKLVAWAMFGLPFAWNLVAPGNLRPFPVASHPLNGRCETSAHSVGIDKCRSWHPR